MTDVPHIPFARPSIGEEEIEAVAATMRSGWLTTGPKTREFEKAFAEAAGARHALAVNSATAGLHLGLEAIGVRADDRVVTPVWTFTASAEVSRYLGAHPLFADVDAATLNLDAPGIEKAMASAPADSRRPIRAVMPVHFAGKPCDMDAILATASAHGLKVVEDAAHTFPAKVDTRSVRDAQRVSRSIGSIGDATVFSFYATKTIATGEGGMVTTDDDEIAERIRVMRLHGFSRDVWNRYTSTKPSWYYEIVAPGYKYNLTDIASAIGLVQLRKSQAFQTRREAIARAYNAAFREIDAFQIPIAPDGELSHSWHLYVLRLNLDMLSIGRDDFIWEMGARGVSCSVHFIPLHMQPYWRDTYKLTPEMFPVASREFERVLSLPIYPDMTEGMVNQVIGVTSEIAARYRR